jgi:hypothetical protein
MAKSWTIAILIAVIAITGLQIYNGFVHRSRGSTIDRNRLCSDNSTKPPAFCDIGSTRSGTPQFKKVLWFVTDGLPVKYSNSLLNYFSDHAAIYAIDVPGAKVRTSSVAACRFESTLARILSGKSQCSALVIVDSTTTASWRHCHAMMLVASVFACNLHLLAHRSRNLHQL